MEEKVKLTLPGGKRRWGVAYIDEDTVTVMLDGMPYGPHDMAMRSVSIAAYSRQVYDALSTAGLNVTRAWPVAVNLRLRADEVDTLATHAGAQGTVTGLCTSIIREWLERQKNNKNNSNDA